MCRIAKLFVMAVACSLFALWIAPPAARGEGTVTGYNGVVLSIYANPFDPDRNFNASETTASYGDPSTGAAGNWLLGWPSATHALDRQDGRNFYADASSSWIYNVTENNGPAAFFQFTAPASFTVRTIITAQDIQFGSYSTPQPFNLKFNTGSPGTTNAAWSAISATDAGPGTLMTHPITVSPVYAGLTADTMRISYASSSISAGSNSQAGMQEVILLSEGLRQIDTSVTPGNGVGYSQDNTGGGGQGIVDNYGGGSKAGVSSIWYDLSTFPATSKFFIVNVDENVPINAMMLFSDLSTDQNGAPAPGGLEFDVFDDAALLIAHVAFDTGTQEILPIRFDTPVTTTSLRFQVTAAPFYDNGAIDPANKNIASIREVMLLTVPEPASAALLAAGALVLVRRRRR